MKGRYIFGLFIIVFLFSSVVFAENLIIMQGDQVKPSLASSWQKIDDNTVRFVLKEPKAAIVQEQVQKALTGKAMVKVIDDKTIEIKGLPIDSVFTEIAKIDIAITESAVAEADKKKNDPFASLGGSGAVALDVPDGSAALRARKKVSFDKDKKHKIEKESPKMKMAPNSPKVTTASVSVDKKQVKANPKNIVAKVLKVIKSDFPHVSLRVLVKRVPRKCKMIRRWKKIDVVVAFDKIDVKDAQFQTNVGANFLRRGDVVKIEISGKDGKKFIATKIERIK